MFGHAAMGGQFCERSAPMAASLVERRWTQKAVFARIGWTRPIRLKDRTTRKTLVLTAARLWHSARAAVVFHSGQTAQFAPSAAGGIFSAPEVSRSAR